VPLDLPDMKHVQIAIVVGLALFSASGCTLISELITSPSESITGTGHAIGGSIEAMSRSVSGTFGIDARHPGYARDLRAYVATFAASGSDDSRDFQRGITRIAESHGIAHWEAEPVTAYAIGQGLREAGVSERELLAALEPARDAPAAELALQGWRGAKN
jgi:hypothetical protein